MRRAPRKISRQLSSSWRRRRRLKAAIAALTAVRSAASSRSNSCGHEVEVVDSIVYVDSSPIRGPGGAVAEGAAPSPPSTVTFPDRPSSAGPPPCQHPCTRLCCACHCVSSWRLGARVAESPKGRRTTAGYAAKSEGANSRSEEANLSNSSLLEGVCRVGLGLLEGVESGPDGVLVLVEVDRSGRRLEGV
eukprot:1057339-Prorocentrum_minimum.AAC.2